MSDDGMKRVGIVFKSDGSVNFQKTLKEVNQTVSENRSAFALAKSEWDKSTSSMDKLRTQQEYLSSQTEAYSDKVVQLTDILEQLESAENRDEVQISKTRQQLNNAQAALNNYERGLEDVNRQLESGTAQLEDYAKKAGEVGDKLSSAGKKMTKGITVPIIGIGTAAGAAWKKIDSAYDNIAAGTGAVGESLQNIYDSFDNVYGNFRADSESTSSAIADINTRLGFTGEKLEECSVQFLKFAQVNNTDVSTAIEKVSRYMGDAGIEAGEYSHILDLLTAASQASGISTDALAEQLTKYGAPMRALGFTTKESIALFAQWEKVGVNTEIAFSGMKKSISNWAKEGKNSSEEFKKMLNEIASAPDIASATTLAIETFGSKAGPDLADAIQNGRFSIEDFMKVVENSSGQLNNSFSEMEDAIDESTIAAHNLQLAGSDLADTALSTFAPILIEIVENIKSLTNWFNGLDNNTKEVILKVVLLVATLGPLLILVGKISTGIGAMITLYTKLAPVLAAVKTGMAGVNLTMSVNPVLLVVAGIVALIAIFIEMYNHCEWFREGVDKLWAKIKEVFTEDIPKAFDATIQWLKDNWQSLLLILINPFAGAFKLIYDNCDSFREKVDGIIDKVKDKWESITDSVRHVVDAVKEGWQDVKDAIKLPHFDISGGFSIAPPKTPKLSVDWYAEGGILNSPTIFGMNGNKMLGGGEAGKEAVLPISNLLDYMRTANTESNNELVNILLNNLPLALAAALKESPIEVMLFLGDKQLSKEMTAQVVKELNMQNANYKASRGVVY